MESVRVGKLNGVPNTSNARLVCTFLMEKTRRTRTSRDTQQSAELRTAVLVTLTQRGSQLEYVRDTNGAPNTPNASLVCPSLKEKPCAIRTSQVTQ